MQSSLFSLLSSHNRSPTTPSPSDTDPSKRLGAGPDGYAPLKKHSFFKGIDWKNLWKTPPPPRLAPIQDVGVDYNTHDNPWNLMHVGGDATYHHDIPDANACPASYSEALSHISSLASIDSFDSRWREFLEAGMPSFFSQSTIGQP